MVLIRRSVTVNVGIVGPGAAWESRYRPALEKLSERIRISAVFDTVAARAAHVAAETDATPVHGVVSLVNRPEIDAVLFLDSAWHGMEALRLLCSGNKPIFIAAEVCDDISALRACHWTAVSYGLTLMPEFGWRYTPATARLQELIATRLGRAYAIRISAEVPQVAAARSTGVSTKHDCLIRMLDWSRYVLRAIPEEIAAAQSADVDGESETIQVRYRPPRNAGPAPTAELTIKNGVSRPDPTATFEIDCENGSAVIESPSVIRWKTESDEEMESLTADRDEIEVMLDLFCRRVVGGLIPVTDLADVYRGLDLIDAAGRSRNSGSPVEVNGMHRE